MQCKSMCWSFALLQHLAVQMFGSVQHMHGKQGALLLIHVVLEHDCRDAATAGAVVGG